MNPHTIAQMTDDAARLTIAAMDTDAVKTLMKQAHLAEMAIECDGAAGISGRYRDALNLHSVYLKCSMELDKRGTDAAVKAGKDVHDILGDL